MVFWDIFGHPRFRQSHMAPAMRHPGAYGASANAAFSSEMDCTGDVRDTFYAHPRGAQQDDTKTTQDSSGFDSQKMGRTWYLHVSAVSRIKKGHEGLKDEQSMV